MSDLSEKFSAAVSADVGPTDPVSSDLMVWAILTYDPT